MDGSRPKRRLRWGGSCGLGKPPAVGLADCLRVCAHHGVGVLARTAALLGEVEPLDPSQDKREGEQAPKQRGQDKPPAPPQPRRKPGELDLATFLRVVAVEQRPPDYRPPTDFGEPLKLEDVTGKKQPRWLSQREGPPLSPWPRLAAHLHQALSQACRGSAIDTRELVRRWSRGRPVQAIPRLTRRRWPERIVVLFDHARRLTPFWPDQHKVYQQLVGVFGPNRIERHVYRTGPGGEVRVYRGDSTRQSKPRKHRGGPVLALTDLGLNERDRWHTQAAWQRFGRRLEQDGHVLHALVPVPREQWGNLAVTKQWQAVAWERKRLHSSSIPALRKVLEHQLLAMISIATRVEPGLLRELRYLVPGEDVGVEAAVWNHPAMASNPNAMFVRDSDFREVMRAKFASLEPDLRKEVLERFKAYHEGMPLEVLGEELLNVRALVDENTSDWGQVRAQILAIASMLSQLEVDPRLRRGYLDWIRGAAERMPAEVWRDSEVGDALTKCFAAYRRVRDEGEEVPIPNGLSPRQLAAVEGEREPPEVWSLGHTGGTLSFTPELSLTSAAASRPWSPLYEQVVSASRLLTVGSHGQQQPFVLQPEATLRIRLDPLTPGGEIVVHTDYTTLTLEGFKPPEWATAIWRDTHGLWAEVKHNEHTSKLRWHPPTGEVGAEGYWRASDPPAWASAMGCDTYGLWADIRVGEVTARMRWIPPGTFLMGPPEGEPGRYADEGSQHRVELTHGFWLGDTPCTQALWQEGMGLTPSHFRGAERPVERVSWQDAVKFCKRLQSRVRRGDAFRKRLQSRVRRGDAFRLPSEAEWEYACRAGTNTATYAGENKREVLEQIAWYSANSEGTTHPVKGLQPNGWGLYDTLGNVWEWCADWLASYPEDAAATAVDSTGSAEGTPRVMRGGSWLDDARYVRAACLRGHEPSFRYADVGFRFARGPALGR